MLNAHENMQGEVRFLCEIKPCMSKTSDNNY